MEFYEIRIDEFRNFESFVAKYRTVYFFFIIDGQQFSKKIQDEMEEVQDRIFLYLRPIVRISCTYPLSIPYLLSSAFPQTFSYFLQVTSPYLLLFPTILSRLSSGPDFFYFFYFSIFGDPHIAYRVRYIDFSISVTHEKLKKKKETLKFDD